MPFDPSAVRWQPCRRDLLLAGASSVFFLREALAAPLKAGAPAKRLLVLNLHGGVRSSAAFHASESIRYNPWGLIPRQGQLSLGQLLDDHLLSCTPDGRAERPLPDAAYTLPLWRNASVPRFREMASRLGVLGTWNPERGDHLRSRVEEVTGSPGGQEPGLLTRIQRALAETRRLSENDTPVFHVDPTAAFGLAPDASARYAPVTPRPALAQRWH